MAGLVDRLYLNSPIPLQQLAVALWGVGWYYRRLGPRFRRLVPVFRDRESWTMEQFREHQQARLSEVFDAAWRSAYYREVFEAAGIKPGMDPWEALRRAPLLSKETLRARSHDLLTVSRLPRGTKVFRSSGTTGTPTDLYYTREFHAAHAALNEVRSLNVVGVKAGDRRVMFGARKVCAFAQDRPPFWRFSPIENLAYGSIYHLSRRFLPHYVAFLRRFKPAIVMGYPSAVTSIARYALETGDLPAPARCVITSSETLTDEMRSALEAAFQCRVLDRYGAVEGCVFAGQCEHGRYHVGPDVGFVEILNSRGESCPPGQCGEIVCTGLMNTLQPLIRYQIGDVSSWAVDQTCSCGRHTPILERIAGRAEDVCLTRDGREVTRFTYVFKGMATIRQAQVVQEQPELFVVYVVPGDRFDELDRAKIEKNMRQHVGDLQVKVQIVPEIPRSNSGKFRPTVCKLSREQRQAILQQAATDIPVPPGVRA